MGQPTDALSEYNARDAQLVASLVANKRKLVTLRTIDALDPIPGADAIEVASVEGWKLVVKKGEFQVGDPCVYFEIDSFLPDGNPAWQFLVDKSSRTFNGRVGHKLRTVKLRGQISQGLALRVDGFPQIPADATRDTDLSELLGVEKWEAPLPAELAGQAEGLFPSFIQKTDQERCQNLKAEIFGYEDVIVPFNVNGMTNEVINELVSKGVIQQQHGHSGLEYVKKLPAKASPDDVYEITMKLDGSSMTVFGRLNGGLYEDGVCSRNLQLKINEANASNTFVSMFINSGLRAALEEYVKETGRSIAVQGELMGPAIQGNREQLKDFQFYVFDIYDIDRGFYIPPFLRMDVFNKLVEYGAKIKHVPVLDPCVKLAELGLLTTDDLLRFAEGPSITHPIREGLVFKRQDGQFSFKAISNKFLEKEKD